MTTARILRHLLTALILIAFAALIMVTIAQSVKMRNQVDPYPPIDIEMLEDE
jgi:hypothetical protein